MSLPIPRSPLRHRPSILAASLALGLSLAAAGALAAPPTGPVQYRWSDASGHVHFSDTLSDAAIARGYDVINSQGVVVQHVPSPQERRAEQAAAKQQAAIDAARAHQQAADAQLLAAYPTEADLRSALEARADNIGASMRATEINLHSQESALADLLQRAAEIEHEKKPVPPFLSHDIAKQRAVVEEQRLALQHQQQQRDTLKAAIEPQLARYRQIKQQMAVQDGTQSP